MAMNLNNPQDPSFAPFTPEQAAQFVEVEPPKSDGNNPSTGDGPRYLTPEEAEVLTRRANQDVRNELNYLKGILSSRMMSEHPQSGGATTELPEAIPVRFGKDGKAVVDRNDLEPMVQTYIRSTLDRFKQEELGPYLPAVAEVQQNSVIRQAAEFVRQVAPELLEGQDENKVGRLAIDLYNSAFNPYTDEQQRTEYALSQLRELIGGKPAQSLPLSTGAGPLPSTTPAYNQVGRTESGSGPNNPFGFAPGATIRIPAKSINELGGIDEYQRYAAYIQSIRDYNRQYNMGWNIVEK